MNEEGKNNQAGELSSRWYKRVRLSGPHRALLLWAAAITLLLLIPLPLGTVAWRWPVLVGDLQDFGHPIAFAWLSHLVFIALRARIRQPSLAPYGWVLAGALAYGLSTEMVQALVGRSPSAFDLLTDMLGSGFALLLHAGAECAVAPRSRWALRALTVLAALLAALPLIATLAAYSYRAKLGSTLWRADNPLFSRLGNWHDGTPPGLVIDDLQHDWRGWNWLEIIVENRQADTLPLIVRVNDRFLRKGGLDRFLNIYQLPPESRQILKISLAQIEATPAGRRLDMTAISRVMILGGTEKHTAAFTVHEVRLLR